MIYPSRFIDSHIHLFNARSLPLEGILTEVPVLKHIAKPLADYFNSITDDFDENVLENELIEEDEFALLTENSSFEEIVESFQNRSWDKLYKLNSNKSFDQEFVDKLNESILFNCLIILEKSYHIDKGRLFLEEKFRTKFFLEGSKEFSEKLFDRGSFNEFCNKKFGDIIRRFLKKLTKQVTVKLLKALLFIHDMGGRHSILVFLASMLKNEASIYKEARNGYGRTPALLVHYMMDMRASYQTGSVFYPFYPDQSLHMKGIADNSNGRLLGFTAYNPRNENPLETVLNGLSTGNVGVKFYPPQNYKPFGDEDLNVRSAVSEFFDHFKIGDVPIFTHCTPVGFEAKFGVGMGLKSDPDNWKRLLMEPGNGNLRICLGHAGGGKEKVLGVKYHGWYSNENNWYDENCYARIVVELCQNYKNVYCEIAHLEKLIKSRSKRRKFVNHLISNWDNNGETPFQLKDKICFGTDWHMLLMINKQEDYFRTMVEIFQDEPLLSGIDDFFFKNFTRFLNLEYYLDNNQVNEINEHVLRDLIDKSS